jgi:hypothetical protein
MMEIKEIVSYYLNTDSNILEVTFRTIDDTDDLLRSDSINYNVVEEYGFELETLTFEFLDEELEDDFFEDDEKVELDEEELINFLNEYYTVNPDLLPKSDFY